MHFLNTDYNFSITQRNSAFFRNKKVSVPDVSFCGTWRKKEDAGDLQKVTSDLAQAYMGVNKSENSVVTPKKYEKPKPLTPQDLSEYKDSMGHQRFDLNEKRDLIFLSRSCPRIRDLMDLKTSKDEPRFTVKDIRYLADINENHPEAIMGLAKIETSYGKPRFSAEDIDSMMLTYEFTPEAVTDLAKMETDYGAPRFSNYDIMNLTTAYFGYPEEVKELAKIKINGDVKFTGYDISQLVRHYRDHKDAIHDLAVMQTKEKPDRFNGVDVEFLAESYEQHPEAVKQLAELRQSKLNGYDIQILTPKYEKYPEAVRELSEIKGSQGNYIFQSEEIEKLAELYDRHSDVINPLAVAETTATVLGKRVPHILMFNTDELYRIASLCDNKKIKKIISNNLDKIKNCKNTSSDNFTELEIDDKIYHIKKGSRRGYKIVGIEKQKNKNGIDTAELKMSDGFVKREEYSKAYTKKNQGYLETITDKNGNVISRTLTKPGKKNTGVLVVLQENLDKDANLTEIKKLGTIDRYGEKRDRRRIERNFVSPLGVESRQLVLEVPKGRRTEYQVGDKKFGRVFKNIDENTTETYVKGNKYETKFNKDNIEINVTRKDGSTEKAVMDNTMVDEKLFPMLKKVPGDFLYSTAKNNIKVLTTYDSNLKDNACFSLNRILISPQLAGDPATFAHEFGHFADEILLKDLHRDKGLKEIFQKELDAYKLKATGMNEEQILYFIAKKHRNRDGCLTELVAESNIILSGLFHDKNHMLLRAKILQENFPETISYVGSKFQEAVG